MPALLTRMPTPPKSCSHRGDHGLVLVPVLHRGGIGLGLAAHGLDLAHRLVGGGGVAAVVDGDVRAGFGQRQGDGRPMPRLAPVTRATRPRKVDVHAVPVFGVIPTT
jgi:hypothetical protein